MALLAEQIPERHRKLVRHVIQPELGAALNENILAVTHLGNSRKVPFDVGGKHAHALGRKALSHGLQSNCLSGAGCAGNQAVPVGEFQREIFKLAGFANQHQTILLR